MTKRTCSLTALFAAACASWAAAGDAWVVDSQKDWKANATLAVRVPIAGEVPRGIREEAPLAGIRLGQLGHQLGQEKYLAFNSFVLVVLDVLDVLVITPLVVRNFLNNN